MTIIHQINTHRTYDIYNRLTSENNLTYTYDPLDRITTITLPDQTTIHYTHNALYLTDVKRIKNQHTYTHHFTHDPAGNIIHSGPINYQYDPLQRIITLTAPHWQETTTYDTVGNLLERHITDPQGTYTRTYTYDDLYQLTSETGITYQNNSLYNRTSKNQHPYINNDLHQLQEQQNTHYLYDPNGNLIEKKQNDHTTTYHYDALDRLIQTQDNTQTTTYRYDSTHRRIKKNETTYLYQGNNEIGAIENGTITQLRILGNTHTAEIGAAIAIELQDKTYLPIHDPYGNIVLLLDPTNNPIETYRYTAFGEIQTHPNTNNPWRYSSKRYDPETNLYYFGRRYYAPDIGRWITPDPIGFQDGLNPYSYVHNHPLTHIDPDGQFIWFIAPLLISTTAEYLLPTTVASLQQYTGGAIAGNFLTGLLRGYNGSIFEPNPLNPDLAGNLGLGLGTLLSCAPGKLTANASKTALNALTREATNTALQAVATNGKKCLTWFASSTTRRGTSAAVQKTSQTAERYFVKEGMPSLDALSKAGQVMDRSGLTKAGRALDKHGARTTSVFPKATGNPASKNMQGQFHLDDILTHPNNKIILDGKKGFEIYAPNGRGIYFRSDGSFRGFVEESLR